MKKLMFAAVAIAAGAVFADGEITSQNIVGYAGSDLNTLGSTLASAQFLKVGNADGSITLGDVKPTAEASVELGYNIEVLYLNNDGSSDPDNDYYWDGSIWINGDGDDKSGVIIPAGKGLWVYNGTGGAAVNFQSSGEVNVKDIAFPMSALGSTCIGNGYPCDRTLGNIVPVAEASVELGYNVEIIFLNNDGSSDPDNDYYWDGSTWINGDGDDKSGVVIPAGKGLWIYNGTGGSAVTIQIAAPEL